MGHVGNPSENAGCGNPGVRLKPDGFDIAVHIRHGDKRDEMTLIRDREFAKAVTWFKKSLIGLCPFFVNGR
jgi:hypothetical protein